MRIGLRLLFLSLLLVGWALAGGGTVADEVQILNDHEYGNFWKRLAAVKRLGKIGTKEAAQALSDVLADATDPPIREAAVLELGSLDDKDAIDYIVGTTLPKAKDPLARANAAWALRLLEKKETAGALATALGDSDPRVRANAAEALGALGDASFADKLVAKLGDNDAHVRVRCALSLAELKDSAAFEAIEKKLGDNSGLVVAECLRALAQLDPQKALPLLQEKVKTKQDEVKIAGIESLAKVDPPGSVPIASTLLQDPDWPVRASAIQSLLVAWQKDGIGALVDRLQKEKGRLRYDIVMALREMTGKTIGFDAKDWKAWWDASKDGFEMPPRPKEKNDPRAPIDNGQTQLAFFNIPLLSDRICFIIDFSGSMKTTEDPKKVEGEGAQATKGEAKVQIAMDELDRSIHRLGPEVKFTVIMMSTEATALKLRTISRKLVPATEANKKLALKLVSDAWDQLKHDKRGRGDFYDATMEAFEDAEVDTVILVSDGVPTYGTYVNEEDIIEYLGRENEFRKVMIHTVVTGTKGTSPKFMTALAEETGGMHVRR